MESTVVSVRIKKDIKAKLDMEGINIEQSIKEFLIQKAAMVQLRREISKLRRLVKNNVKPSKKGFGAKSVREDRYAAH